MRRASGSGSRALVREIVIIVALVAAILVGVMVGLGTYPHAPFYVVSSGSMIPELQIYDVIVVKGNDPFEEVEVGDIIVFDRPAGNDRVIVHRVVAIVDDDPFTVRTQGDANPASIPGTDFPITAEEYIGTVAYVIPQAGFVTRIFATQILGIPLNYIIIAVIIGIIIAKHMTGRKADPGEGGGAGHSPGEGAGELPEGPATGDAPADSQYVDGERARPGVPGNDADRPGDGGGSGGDGGGSGGDGGGSGGDGGGSGGDGGGERGGSGGDGGGVSRISKP